MKKSAAVALSLLVLWPASAPLRGQERVDLSPASWPAGELETFSELNQISFGEKPGASSEAGMVVGTTGALAVRAGLEALRQGGSAMDAALVTALTQTTLAAGSWVSFAGILSLVHYDAGTRKVRYLNGEFNTPLGEEDPLSIPASQPSGRTALVPGFMAAVEAAHGRYGRLPFETLFEPAVYFAEEGFTLDGDLADTMAFRSDVLGRRPDTRAIFFKPDGTLYKKGETFRQPQLAATLRRLADEGAGYMYTGAWARRLVAALAGESGKMSLEDLERYEAIWKKTRRTRYRRYRVHGPSRPGAGGALAAKALKRLRAVDLAGLGHYSESARSLFELMFATRLVYEDVPPLHSDGVIAADPEGNVVALLHSINTSAWGLTGIFVDGVSIPDAAANQQQRVLAAGPGNRIWTATNPLMVIRKRRPVLASSAIGRGLFEASMQSVVNVLDYGMDAKEAVDTVTFRAPRRTTDGGIAETLVTHGDFPADLLQAVRDMGIPIGELPLFNFDSRGFWVGVSFDRESGEMLGATTDFLNGRAVGL